MVVAKLGKDDVEFLVDMGATYSALNTLKGKLNQDTVNVIGAMRVSETRPFFQPLKFKFGKLCDSSIPLYAKPPQTIVG